MNKLFAPAKVSWTTVVICAILFAATYVAAIEARPTALWADVIKGPSYNSIIPAKFGDWVLLPQQTSSIVNPVQEEELMKLYSETVSKTYLYKPTGQVIMLSMAYGRNQSTDVQIHTPEQCYPSQGFRVDKRYDHEIQTQFGAIKAVRMETSMGLRKEPLTFFLRVGDSVARGSKERNLARLKMALHGYLIDGLLFRVSEITDDADASFKLQDKFIQDLLNAVSPEARPRLIGSPLIH